MISLDRVFQALSDPTRRGIVSRLGRGPETTGDLVAAFPRLSRVAVMKHLDVLAAAGLMKIRRKGRFRWNELRGARLARAERWLSRRVERLRDMGMKIKLISEEGPEHD